MEINESDLTRLEAKLDAVHAATEKTRKYVLTLLISLVVMAVLPIIMGVLMVPFLMSTLGGAYGV